MKINCYPETDSLYIDLSHKTGVESPEASFGQQDSAVGSRIAKNAEFNDTMPQMNAVKSTVTHMVPNFCSGHPGAIAAWHSATHVEAPPKKKPPTPPPTP